ncbi:MAG: preprotein translocase subunit SecE [Deltaproteobacteria bacterium]|nr:preprotein translocase subunit SecE [Deltaproteobacteria bacterium]
MSWWFQARQFLREVKVELKKVTWPNRKETIGSTLVVIVVVLLMSFYFGIIDLIFGSILGKILK